MQMPPHLLPPEATPPPLRYPQWWAMANKAFADTETCRQYGMAIGPIPWTALNDWCTAHGLTGQVRLVLIDIVRRMDAQWLDAEYQRTKEKSRHG